MIPLLGRFAPSPTGTLHVGNLRTALASWLSGKSRGGHWIIRVEDVDAARCKTDIARAQIRDLARLGLESDGDILHQSARSLEYRAALERLHDLQRLYPCACSRKDLAMLASAPHAEDGVNTYPGTCRNRPWEGFERALRLRLPVGEAAWEDLLLGSQSDDPNVVTGDPLLFRRDGFFAYHLAVVVDDGDQGVTEIVRGSDLRAVTATQIRLQEALGYPRPAYAHVGLVTSPDGSRLGKRGAALGIDALADHGVGIEALLGWLGWSLGCLEHPEPCRVDELIPHFRWNRVPKGAIAIPKEWF